MVECYVQILAIETTLGEKENEARDYANLGIIYEKLGNKIEAKRHYQISVKLFKKFGSDKAHKVQFLLNLL